MKNEKLKIKNIVFKKPKGIKLLKGIYKKK
jgi:hypothetical protein